MNSNTMYNLRLLKLKSENINGMTTDIDFDSNLAIIYGYNRDGKTIIVNIIQYAIKGFKPEGIELEIILGNNSNGFIELVFGFKGIVYRIFREITPQHEHVTFQKAEISNQEYLKLTSKKKDIFWSSSNIKNIIPRVEIRTRGESVENYIRIMEDIKLYPQIIDRIIALENKQEFMKATKTFASKEGGGYDTIKELLFSDLKDKSDSIEGIITYGKYTVSKLDLLNITLERNYHNFIEDILEIISKNNITDNIKKELIDTVEILKFEADYNSYLNNFKQKLNDIQDNTNSQRKIVEGFKENLKYKKESFQTLEKLLDSTRLSFIEKNVEIFNNNKPEIDNIFKSMSSIYRDIENNPLHKPILKIDMDFNYLFEEKLNELITSKKLDSIDNEDKFLSFTTNINHYIDRFNDALKLYKRRKEISTLYNIDSKDFSIARIDTIIYNYQEQIKKIKNPTIFKDDDEKYHLIGRVEQDPFSNEKVLNFYMSLQDLKDYFSKKYPVNLGRFLSIFTESKDEKIPNDIINELIKSIEVIIKDYKELKEIEGQLEQLMNIARQDLNDFQEIIENLDYAQNIINQWNEYITERKSVAIEFIKKNLKEAKIRTKNFKVIKKNLSKINDNFTKELSTEFKTMKLDYNNSNILLKNLEIFEHVLDKSIENLNLTDDILQQIFDYILNNQDKYNNVCRDKEINDDLKEKIIPAIQVIISQIKSNIKLEETEKMIINKIITYAQSFYYDITKEGFLIFKRFDDNDKIYLRPYLKRGEDDLQPLMDTSPAGSEQAAVSLGIMVALADFFHTFLVIDEVADRFDYPTKLRFFNAIKKYSKDLFIIIVLKIDSGKSNLEEEFERISSTFPEANILQPTKNINDLTMQVRKIKAFSDIKIKGD